MRRYVQFVLLLLATTFAGLRLQAQVPDSVAITTDGSWIIEHASTSFSWNGSFYDWITTYSYAYFRSGGDTLINGTVYTVLLRQGLDKNANGEYFPSPFQTEQYFCAYRNDMNRRAFRVPNGSTVEEPWYDFNLTVGDTVWNPNTLGTHQYLLVTGIDSVDYCGAKYENYNFVDENSSSVPGSSIQGVGSTFNFIRNYATVFEADRLVHFCEPSAPFSYYVGIRDPDDAAGIESLVLYPNPAENLVHLSMKKGLLPSKIVIRSLTGEIVGQNDSRTTEFSVEDLPNGLYFVTIEAGGKVQTVKLVKN